MNSKKWFFIFSTLIFFLVMATVGLTVLIDPFLHYHKPLKGLEYPLTEPRYTNDGIARHWDYDALIIGTSMADNFSPSLMDELFHTSSIKTTYSGATYHELSENIERAIKYQPNLKLVVCSLDPNRMNLDEAEYSYDEYPWYMYDNNLFNDCAYVFNKDVWVKTIAVLNYTRSGQKTPSFDTYESFDQYAVFGKEAVLKSYTRMEIVDLWEPFTQEDKAVIHNNVYNNYIRLAENNPDIEFCFFIPPYSVCYWDGLKRTNQTEYAISSMKCGIEDMLQVENIHIYGFDLYTEITTNLDYYMDTLHYNRSVNDLILRSIAIGKDEITVDNLDSYYERIEAFYADYEPNFELER